MHIAMCARAHVCTFQSHVGYTRMECLCQRLEIYRRSLLLRHCRLLWKKIIEKLCFSSFPPYIKGYFRKFVEMDISLSTDFCKSKKKFTMMKFQRKFESQNLSPLGIKKKKKMCRPIMQSCHNLAIKLAKYPRKTSYPYLLFW